MNKQINELNREELRKVFDYNKELQHDVLEDAHESEIMWIDGHLTNLSSVLNDYSISPCAKPYIFVNPNRLRGFIEGVIQNQKDYGVMPDDWNEKAEDVALIVDAYYEEDIDSDRYDELEEQAEKQAQELADDIADQYEDMLQFYYDDEQLFRYFSEVYIDLRMDDGEFYVNDDYELFEQRTVSYA